MYKLRSMSFLPAKFARSGPPSPGGERLGHLPVAILLLSAFFSALLAAWWSTIFLPRPSLFTLLAAVLLLAAGLAGSLVGRRREKTLLRRQIAEIEAKVHCSEREAAEYFENAGTGMHFVRQDGTILAMNGAGLEMLGYSREECVGRNVVQLQADPQAAREMLRRLAHGEVLRGVGVRMQCKDGSLREVLVDADVLWREGNFIHARFATRDITEPKRAEAELKMAKENTEAAARAKDRFLAVLSHELRTPLTPALLAVSELERNSKLPVGARLNLGIIRRNVELEARLIDDLLELTRISRGKLELNLSEVETHSLIRKVVDLCKADIDFKQLEVEVDLRASRRKVYGDPARLQQVFWNLLRNAIKFTPTGGRIAVRSEDQDGRVSIQVADSGIGIDPQDLARIFEAFEHAGSSIAQHSGGLGLGLSISHAVVEAHGGSLRVESGGAGEGSTFTAELPVIKEKGVRDSSSRKKAKEGAAKPLSILVVEDHEDTAQVLAHVLETLHYRVRAVGTMESALELAESQRFDLLISDIGLPDGSGLELMWKLSRKGPIKGIALSGYGMDSDVRLSRDAGFAVHLTKPVDMTRLMAEVARLSSQPMGHKVA